MFDAFLSHRTSDKPLVKAIAEKLKRRGIRPFLDEWHLIPGEPWQEGLERALDTSRTCVVFLGPSGLGTWENEEMRSALETRLDRADFRVIPVLLPGADPRDAATLPRFLRRLTFVDFRPGVDDTPALERLVAGINGTRPGAESPAAHLQRGVIHVLPPAPEFIGRERELSALREFWEDDEQRILALTGLGGAGKTALAAEFVGSLLRSPAQQGLQNLFVWSFYIDIDVDNLLRTAFRHFSGVEVESGAGTGLLFRLTDALHSCEKTLIVFDGLERIQKPVSDLKGGFGQIDDSLLRQLISKLAFGIGSAKCLITSRFPLSDLRAWRDSHFRTLPIDQLTRPDAMNLLRRAGIRGTDASLIRLLDEYGSHALTLDHLSTYLAEFRNGDPDEASRIPEPRIDSDVPEERRLARVLSAYETALSEREIEVLKRVSVFRLGTSAETILDVFSRVKGEREHLISSLTEDDVKRVLSRLLRLHLLIHETEHTYTAHPAVRDHFYRLYTDAASAHNAVTEALKQRLGLHIVDALRAISSRLTEVRTVAMDPRLPIKMSEEALSLLRPTFRETEFGSENALQIARSYGDALNGFISAYSVHLTDETKAEIRQARRSVERLVKRESKTVLRKHVRLKSRPGVEYPDDPRVLDVLEEIIYHSIQAGSTPDAFNLYLFRLGGRAHLANTLGEFSRGARILGYFPASPAPVDLGWYLRGLGNLQESSVLFENNDKRWAGAVLILQGRLSRVIGSPYGWPQTQFIAEFLTGRTLGKMLRRDFGWGEPYLDAELYMMRSDLDDAEKCLATSPAYRELDHSPTHGRRSAESWTDSMHSPLEINRARLVTAELARRRGNRSGALAMLDKALPWITSSASAEHLCLAHLYRARLFGDSDRVRALAAVNEGIDLAQRGGFSLYHVDLQNCRAGLLCDELENSTGERSSRGRKHLVVSARLAIRSALNGIDRQTGLPPSNSSSDPDRLQVLGARHEQCGYIWGQIESLRQLVRLTSLLGMTQRRDRAAQTLQRLAASVNIQS